MSKIRAYIKLLRPRQWVKNFFVLAPLFFGGKLFDQLALVQALSAMLVFCLSASSIYVFNDLRDREVDKQHPKNCHRPIASGRVTAREATLMCIILSLINIGVLITLCASNILPASFILVLAAYLTVNIGYSSGLKHISLFEIFLVASGYVLRVIAGCYAISVDISPWLLAATGIVSLLIVSGKRRSEMLGDDKKQRRKATLGYNISFLDSLISLFGASALVTYMLFTLSDYAIQKFNNENLVATSVFVAYGIARYIQLIKVYDGAEAPTELLLSDSWIRGAVLLWVVSLFAIIYIK